MNSHLLSDNRRVRSRLWWLFDVRTGALIVTLWSAVIVVLGGVLGFFSSPFFRFGPSPTAVFFSQPIDTWPRWCGIVVYTLVQQLVSTYALETISPWMMNQVQNRRVRTLRESEPMTLSIVSFWYLYMWISRVVSIQILLSQIDFLLLVLAVDLITTFLVTKFYYLRDKQSGIATSHTSLCVSLTFLFLYRLFRTSTRCRRWLSRCFSCLIDPSLDSLAVDLLPFCSRSCSPPLPFWRCFVSSTHCTREMLTVVAFTIVLLFAAIAAAHDDHEHEESCACVAKELGFAIDCTAQAPIVAAFKLLQDSACGAAKCKTDAACKKAFALVQAHHDHCFTDQVPTEIEAGLHAFEAHCETCAINKQFMPSRPACAAVVCSAAANFTAAHTYLKDNNCSTACGAAQCAANFQIVRAAHDTCDHDDVPTEIEEAVHTFEDACSAQECNTVAATFTPTCTDDDHDHDHDTTGAAGTTTVPTSSATLSARWSTWAALVCLFVCFLS
jgi:hypothetical protein